MKVPNMIRILAASGMALAVGPTVLARPEAAGAAAGPALQHPTWMTTPTNAALLYFRYWTMMPAEDEKAIADAVAGLSEEEKALWVPTGELAEKLKANASYFNGVTKATRLPSADWGIEYDEGFMALIPHLSQMRRCVRVFDADSRRLFAAGDNENATARIAAMVRMANHVSDGGLLISSLVGAVVLETGLQRADAALAQGKMDQKGAATLLEALRPFRSLDPFQFRKCIEGEGWVVTGGLKSTFRGPAAAKDFAAMMSDLDSFKDKDGAGLRTRVEALDEAAFYADLDRSGEYYRQVQAAWDRPDAKQRIGELEKRLAKGEFGLTGQVVGAAFGKAYDRSQQIRTRVQQMADKLEALANQ